MNTEIYLSLLLLVLGFAGTGILTAINGSGVFSTTANVVVVASIATVATIVAAWRTWSGLLGDDARHYKTEASPPTVARFHILILVLMNIFALALWNLLAIVNNELATTPPIDPHTPLVYVFMECIYTSTFVASGIGFGRYVDAHWSTMLVSYITSVYISMLLRPIVFAKILIDMAKGPDSIIAPQKGGGLNTPFKTNVSYSQLATTR
jgi:hypothetical protein